MSLMYFLVDFRIYKLKVVTICARIYVLMVESMDPTVSYILTIHTCVIIVANVFASEGNPK